MHSDIRSFPGRPSSTAPLARTPAPVSVIRHTGHWAELLSDLVCLDDLIIETAGPATSVSHRTSMASLRLRGDHGILDGSDIGLRLLLDRVRSVAPETPEQRGNADAPPSITLEGSGRAPLLILRAPGRQDASGFLMKTLMRTHGISGAGIMPIRPEHGARNAPSAWSSAQMLDDGSGRRALELARDVAEDDNGMDPLDAAEIAGPLSLHPQRLRARGEAVGVDPDLVACALETLADNVVPLTLLSGNAGVVLRVNFTPFAARQGPGRQYVRGEGTSLCLNTRAIDSAWVFGRHDDPAGRRQLRVYDDSGRPLFMLSAQPATDGGDPGVWRALINALLS